jgi:AraC-like DNA-binding protein
MSKKHRSTEDWLHSPIESDLGTLWLAGHLSGNDYIPKHKMRILGRYALILVLDGEVYYKDDADRSTVLQKDHAVFVTPDLAHAYGGLNGSSWSQSYMVFDGPQFDLLQSAQSIHSKQPFFKIDSAAHWSEQFKDRILAHSNNPNSQSAIRTISQFSKLLVEMITEAPRSIRKEDQWLKTSKELLERPQNSEWMPPTQVAKAVGMSYENFRKLFTRHAGVPPAKFQRQRKIDRACSAIYRESVNFKELAEELEFCDVYHFSKAFRQVKGMPPSSYRRSVRGE